MTNADQPFVPDTLDATDFAALEPYYKALFERPVGSSKDLERWLKDRSELESTISEAGAELYIATTCDTQDQAASDAYTAFIENVQPRIKPLGFELDRRFVELADEHRLDPSRYAVLLRRKRAAVRLFRDENVPIQTELDKLSQQFGRIAGAMTVEYQGQERTLQQMSVFIMDPERSTREEAWSLVCGRRLQDRDTLDDLYDTMIRLRHQMATNAGFEPDAEAGAYVHYEFMNKERFDYTPADCRAFWDGVAEHVVPLLRRLDDERRSALGVETLRPWDLACDPHGRPPMRPFDGGRQLVDRSVSTFKALDPRLAEMLQRMAAPSPDAAPTNGAVRTEYLDLDSRKAKRPGGYMYSRDKSGRPFIFMNAAGVTADVRTMIHEAGHAFHTFLCAPLPLMDDRDYPTEFAEVASMSMEHLTMPHWQSGGFYPQEEDFNRARREHLEGAVGVLAWIATIDAFQHWIYANPGHTRQQRCDHWLTLDDRFGHRVDWSGLEEQRRTQWQRQSHLFSHPLYYIEYGIAQLGALQLWLKSREEGERAAVDAYMRAMRLGGSRPLPELFEAAGLTFDFGGETIRRITDAVSEELEGMPV